MENNFSKIKTTLEVKISDFLKQLQPSFNSVYHYTTAEGLKGIIDSESLWLTDRNYMNDLYDKGYSINLFSKAYRNNSDLVDTLRMFSDETTDYVFSLSIEGDLSNQWVHYSKQSGYCLEFDVMDLIEYMKNMVSSLEIKMSLSYNYMLYKVEDQNELINLFLNGINEMYQEVKDYNHGLIRCYSLYSHITSHIKHYNNHCEKEYRFTLSEHKALKDEVLDKDYVIRNGIFNPIIKLPTKHERLPIKSIIISPYINNVNTKKGLLSYIRNKWGEVTDDFVKESESLVSR